VELGSQGDEFPSSVGDALVRLHVCVFVGMGVWVRECGPGHMGNTLDRQHG